ncbi:MAG: anhydro-N-acetylmuramic acid kinase [Thiotrichales bacterium]|nr:anhydro-N-acetylmuramic acid kinase [Thiotrichales bacterium]
MKLYIGLISGTSMDGVDAALVAFPDGGATTVATHSVPIPDDLTCELHALAQDPSAAAIRFWTADAQLGSVFADAVLALLDIAGTEAHNVAAIGSHGQTVYHAPKAATPITVQLGDPNIIAERTGITTVADFRRRDLAAGGEGAPLATAFHRAVFSAPGVERGILNLGGIANLSVLSAERDRPPLGFDTGPANTLLDTYVRRRFATDMDREAALARQGKMVPALLAELLAEPYFDRAPPKSTGRELFNAAWLDARLARHPGVDPHDVLRTLCELTVETAMGAVTRFAPRTRELYLCGGGARNPLIAERIAERIAPLRVDTTDLLGIAPDWVEAAAFAWLAMRTLGGEAGNAPSVTGAGREVVLGGIHHA